jgi:hypothetical protein
MFAPTRTMRLESSLPSSDLGDADPFSESDLREALLTASFKDFAVKVCAVEYVEFWLAVEQYREANEESWHLMSKEIEKVRLFLIFIIFFHLKFFFLIFFYTHRIFFLLGRKVNYVYRMCSNKRQFQTSQIPPKTHSIFFKIVFLKEF